MKAPAYLFYLRDFAAHYPGARFVMTHRDPAVAIPSACSVVEAARRLLVPSWSSDPATLGREVLEHFSDGIQQATADRAALGEERLIDIGQKELEADGVGTAGRIYEFLGLQLTDEVRDTMSRMGRRQPPRGSRGEHRYSPEQYGLTTQQIVETFRAYIDRFGAFCS